MPQMHTENQSNNQKKKPIALVLFGGSGDLTFRKLLPAMYNHYSLGSLDREFEIIPIGRRDLGVNGYRDQAEDWVREHTRVKFSEETYKTFRKRIHYFRMDFAKLSNYDDLETYLADTFPEHQRVFYYAVAPESFDTITRGVAYAKLNRPGSRMILEKPFGDNLRNARLHNEVLEETYGNENIFHIDHYLGKEMIRNILTVRFTNAIFSGIWNRHFIDNVQINAFETVGVETRGAYYDNSGAFRDMVQNHLFQVLSVLALEQPREDTPEALHEAQLEVLKSLRPINGVDALDHMVLGQYEGYRDEPRVDKESKTATYAALSVYVDTPRWLDVPFYIRTGKKLHKRDTEIIINFRQTDLDSPANVLVIKIQPDEGIFLRFNVKKPGSEQILSEVHMDYCQSCNLENYQNTPEAYERLLAACFDGDHTLFSRWDQIEASWEFANRLLDAYKAFDGELYPYEVGSFGPETAEDFLAKDGRKWVYDLVGDGFKNGFGNENDLRT